MRRIFAGTKFCILAGLMLAGGGCYYFSRGEIESRPLSEIKTQIENAGCENSGRFLAVKKLFSEVGAGESDIEVETYDGVENIVLTLRGKSDETVYVGAHYDKTTLGCGVIDNWTGVVIVANLYRSLREKRNEKTYKFIAFGKEERGLVGSKAMVSRFDVDAKKSSCVMVNFDSFGFADTWAPKSISSKSLTALAREVAKKRNAEFEIRELKGASSDSKSFLDEGIPAITFSGLGNNWRNYIHRDKDVLKNVSMNKVYENYLFAIDYLKKIDSTSCVSLR